MAASPPPSRASAPDRSPARLAGRLVARAGAGAAVAVFVAGAAACSAVTLSGSDGWQVGEVVAACVAVSWIGTFASLVFIPASGDWLWRLLKRHPETFAKALAEVATSEPAQIKEAWSRLYMNEIAEGRTLQEATRVQATALRVQEEAVRALADNMRAIPDAMAQFKATGDGLQREVSHLAQAIESLGRETREQGVRIADTRESVAGLVAMYDGPDRRHGSRRMTDRRRESAE